MQFSLACEPGLRVCPTQMQPVSGYVGATRVVGNGMLEVGRRGDDSHALCTQPVKLPTLEPATAAVVDGEPGDHADRETDFHCCVDLRI